MKLKIFLFALPETFRLSLRFAFTFVALTLAAQTLPAQQDAPLQERPEVIKPESVKVGKIFPSIKGKAIDGRGFDLTSAKTKTATVVALTSTSCPVCINYTTTLAALEKKYRSRNVQFCFLNTIPSDEADDIQSAVKRHGFIGPYIHDKTDKWNEAFEIRTTAEVFVFDSDRKLVYRGAVDDQYGIKYSLNKPRENYLVDALDSLIANNDIKIAATTAPGCDILLPKFVNKTPPRNNVTFHNRISRIIQNNCVDCHRDQGLAPFSLETADDLAAHAGMIKKVVNNGTMPPWFAKQGEYEWANERKLTDSEKKDLTDWLVSSRELGNPSDAVKPKEFTSEWNIGKPDEIVAIRDEFKIKATGTMKYQYSSIWTDFGEDKWVSAVEIRPTARLQVHHVLVFLQSPGGGRDIDGTNSFFAAYVPGNTFQIFPPGFAKKVPKGARFVVQLHYTPKDREVVDRTEIGFKFFEGTPKHVVRVMGVKQESLNIPANDPNCVRSNKKRINSHRKILAFFPHMHLRGKSFDYKLVRKNGESKTLLEIPRYDFNWQLVYRLAEPLDVYRDDFIHVTGTFNNSKSNPAIEGDDYNRVVPWGDQTYDEMLIGYIEYYNPNEVISGENNGAPKPENKIRSAGQPINAKRAKYRAMFVAADTNNDDRVSPTEFKKRFPQSKFLNWDRNQDGFLTIDEVFVRIK